MVILAIDPGNEQSAAVLMDETTYKPIKAVKQENEALLEAIREWEYEEAAIEMVASYGMPVGKTVFDTCVWIGRYEEAICSKGVPVSKVYRAAEKLCICHSPKANDATIRQALVDRFADGVPNGGKGSKKAPGWFYGFRADIWQAYAVGVTYLDTKRGYYHVERRKSG